MAQDWSIRKQVVYDTYIPFDNRTRSQVIILLYTSLLSVSFFTRDHEHVPYVYSHIWMKLPLLINLTSPFLSIWQIAIDTKISCHFLWFSSWMCVCVYIYIYFDVSIINITMHMRMVINLFTRQREISTKAHVSRNFKILMWAMEILIKTFSFISRAANWSSRMHIVVSIREEVINLPFVKTS